MSDNSDEKVQIEGLIEDNKVVISDPKGISEFYENSYIGTLEENKEKKVLNLTPIEVLLLIERHRLLLWIIWILERGDIL
ncbi:MAG: hypothetical protein P8Y97_02280 [Candidatus Lokiarchaeota archaeon]